MRAFIYIFRVFIRICRSATGAPRMSGRKTLPIQQRRPSCDLLKAKVSLIIDGDTLIVHESCTPIRVRLAAIDCPEDDQRWGDIAKAGLIKLIGGRHVHLETYGLDCYGRTLATIFVMTDSGLINVNERMVMLGHAWVTRMYDGNLSKSRQIQLDKLESWAKSKRVGLWRDENPIPPWHWRNSDDDTA